MKSHKIAKFAILISLGSAIYFLETLIPFPLPVPGGRWGFSNMVILISLPGAPIADLLTISVGKNILGSLISGKIATPGFLMGLSGVSGSVAVMWYMWKTNIFGLAGISITGAAVNNLIQLTIAAFYIIGDLRIFELYPYFFLTGSISAFINAYVAYEVLKRVGESLWLKK